MRPIEEVAAELGIAARHVTPCGRGMAKVHWLARDEASRRGRLVLVSAITPTRQGEGKTTVSIGLAMGLRRLGTRATVCLRQPSQGPVFGIKGGGTGGGRAQLTPAADINLHFTGDLHAVTAAHNLIAAFIDHALYFERAFGPQHEPLAVSQIPWPRVLDVDDRALRNVLVGHGGGRAGVPREMHFEITAASELMAVLALSRSLEDLRARLRRTLIARTGSGHEVSVGELGIAEATLALLTRALEPNLVQTVEGGPAFVHTGPFANIAHGCSSVLATELALAHGEIAITEAGFDFSLGGEKFLDIKCRSAGLWPDVVVLVATLRALLAHGAGGDDALALGLTNLERHVALARKFGLTPIIAINVFEGDHEGDLTRLESMLDALGLAHARVDAFRQGGPGGESLAQRVIEHLAARHEQKPRFLYALDLGYEQKLATLAREAYGASGVDFTPSAREALASIDQLHPGLPVCVAKTPLSFGDDPFQGPLARNFVATVVDVKVMTGAGFVVARMGNIETMPGLPRSAAAFDVEVETDGSIRGLMQGETAKQYNHQG